MARLPGSQIIFSQRNNQDGAGAEEIRLAGGKGDREEETVLRWKEKDKMKMQKRHGLIASPPTPKKDMDWGGG